MKRSLAIRFVLVLLMFVGWASISSCQKTPPSSPPAGSADASITAPAGTPVLSLHIEPVVASVNETISAKVIYTNVSSWAVEVVAAGGAFYNVRVMSSEGEVVFDSFPYPPNARLPRAMMKLAPGATSSGVVRFRLKEPGRYAAVAYTTNGLTTPKVTIVVSR